MAEGILRLSFGLIFDQTSGNIGAGLVAGGLQQ